MNRFQYINQNIARIKVDVRIGITSSYILRHFEVYSRYDYYRRLGHNVRSSAMYAGDDFRINETYVFKIKKFMETII
jgi:hypothetical protein